MTTDGLRLRDSDAIALAQEFYDKASATLAEREASVIASSHSDRCASTTLKDGVMPPRPTIGLSEPKTYTHDGGLYEVRRSLDVALHCPADHCIEPGFHVPHLGVVTVGTTCALIAEHGTLVGSRTETLGVIADESKHANGGILLLTDVSVTDLTWKLHTRKGEPDIKLNSKSALGPHERVSSIRHLATTFDRMLELMLKATDAR